MTSCEIVSLLAILVAMISVGLSVASVRLHRRIREEIIKKANSDYLSRF